MTAAATTPATILIVDDVPENISLLNVTLMIDNYVIKAANSGKAAIDICLSTPVDLILLDVMMPDMDGFETCRLLKENPLTSAIPVIFVTARRSDEVTGFSCGAVDYVSKPICAPVVRARVRTHLALYDQNRTLQKLELEQTKLNVNRLELLHRFGGAGEYQDNETGHHVGRVCQYSRIIAQGSGLPENEAELIYNAAALHDIGKIGVPESILFKPGKLDEDEWKIMRTHCEIGQKIIGDSRDELLTAACTIALTHHERWDGSGYPAGLTGKDIPLYGQIVSIADMFDALTSIRPYKKPWSVADAIAEVERCRDGHFDPQLVNTFMAKLPELKAIHG